jgi:hypothetical protein
MDGQWLTYADALDARSVYDWPGLTLAVSRYKKRRLVGISRSQTSNVIVGRFGVSRSIAQRVLELTRAA